MVKAKFFNNGYSINGHANFDELGKDIICASISFLAQVITHELSDYLIPEKTIFDEVNAKIFVLIDTLKCDIKVKALIDTLKNGMLQLAKQYPEFVETVITDESI